MVSPVAKALSVPVALLRPNPWNSNVVSPENEAKLDRAIKRLGLFKPIVVRQHPDDDALYEILGGAHRWESAQRCGLESVPIFNLGVVADAKAKEISLADNARYGVDDATALNEILSSLPDVDELSDFLPFTDSDLSAIFSSDIALDELDFEEDEDAKEEKDDDPAEPKVPRTHTVMKFKVTLADSERITRIIAETQRELGLSGNDLSNAGDALAHLLIRATGEAE